MSNQQVLTMVPKQGVVFDRVIQEVCDSSQVDFEEGGVDQQTLEDLRKGWRKKLSSLGVAHFPWDPAPLPPPPPPQPQQHPPQQHQPAPIPAPPVTVPSNAPRTSPPPQHHPQQHQQHHQLHQPLPSQIPVSAADSSSADVRIKQEPGYQPSGLPPVNSLNLAQRRAADALHQRYGAAAANQVHQLQAQSQAAALSLPGQKLPGGVQIPGPMPHDPKAATQPPQQYHNPTQPQHRPMNNSQTDGASDSLQEWKAEVARRREAAEKNQGGDGHLLRLYVESRGLQLEAGGLLAPLNEQPSFAKGVKRKAYLLSESATADGLVPAAAAPGSSKPEVSAPAPYDGVDDYNGNSKEEDEDAINSDLDDPEDLLDDSNDGDDAVGQVMLCTYDKVQRVKSKWKCTLKDGILTSGGKEYVFHKGQGEFEWY
ncbi:transcription factor IIA subunit alpha [Onygenales sp. PD_12]|nr:transcription factor IIA subunit alpha [Emmonsiellopsis sp. PD_33]KAK2787756.1 transcription factor IIA subunit alpha [Onygenales sp. PD_12]KAK2805913.1 transcription factor IIA subunit alpha [Onygenales sp. PD_10]